MINKLLNFLKGNKETTVKPIEKTNTYVFPDDGTVHYSDKVPAGMIPNNMLPPEAFNSNLLMNNLGPHIDFPSDFHVLARATSKREKVIQ